MRLEKIILCTAIALTAFGASLGLLEIGAYIRAAFRPMKVEIKPIETLQAPVVYPQRIPDVLPTETSAPVEEPEPEDTGVNGDYYIIGENPKGFKNFDQLTIQDRDWSEKEEKLVPIKPRGIIVEGDDMYDLSWVEIKGKRVSLESEKRRGVSYRFEGTFVSYDIEVKSEDGETYTETVYLKGRLSKWSNGAKVAEAKVRLGITHGC